MKHTGLGKGLDALIPASSEAVAAAIREIPVEEIDPNRSQPRRSFEEDKLEELAASISEHGILSPILVVENGSRYRIVAGERRYRAARQAGLSKVPCIVRDMTGEEQMAAALVENLQRQDLNPIEEAAAIESLMKEYAFTQEEVAQKLGKSRSSVANSLRLLKLPREIADLVISGELSEGHAKLLCGLEDRARQFELAGRCIEEGWSVRALEASLREKPPTPGRKAPAVLSPEMQSLVDSFRNVFGLNLQWNGNEKKGKISFRYQSPQELELLYEILKRLEKGELNE